MEKALSKRSNFIGTLLPRVLGLIPLAMSEIQCPTLVVSKISSPKCLIINMNETLKLKKRSRFHIPGFMFYGDTAEDIEWRVHADRSRPHSFTDSHTLSPGSKLKASLVSSTRPYRYRFAMGNKVISTKISKSAGKKVRNYLAFVFG